MSEAISAIEEYVGLTMQRHRGSLPVDDRWCLETLEDVLRDLIDGARPAPRRIENPSPAKPTPAQSAVAPAKVTVTKNEAPQFGPGTPGAAPPAPEAPPPPPRRPTLELSNADQSKVKEVAEEELPPSGYTPSSNPCFLEDYYTADLSVLASSPPQAPTRVRHAAGASNLELLKEARMLLGIEEQAMAAPPRIEVHPTAPKYVTPAAAPVVAEAASTARAASTFGSGTTIVHLLAGGFKRGTLVAFDPGGGGVQITLANGSTETIATQAVLAVFFGLGKGESPSPMPAGHRLAVKLVNDRDVVGVSPDYAPGVQSMFVHPEDRRGAVERIWVPAWSVKEIHFA